MKRIIFYVLWLILPLGVWGQTEILGVDFPCGGNCDLAVNISPQPAVLCSGSVDLEIEISGASGVQTTEWSDGITSHNRSINQAGSYTITVSDEAGCNISKTIEVGNGSDPTFIKDYFESKGFASISVTILEENPTFANATPRNTGVEIYSNINVQIGDETFILGSDFQSTISRFNQDMDNFDFNGYITSNGNFCTDEEGIIERVNNDFETRVGTPTNAGIWLHAWDSGTDEENSDLLFVKVSEKEFYSDFELPFGKSYPVGHPVYNVFDDFNKYVHWSFIGSNNTGTKQFHLLSKGLSTDPLAIQKSYGAIGEGLFGWKLLQRPVNNSDLYFGHYVNGKHTDLIQGTWLYRIPYFGHFELKINYTDYEGNEQSSLLTVLDEGIIDIGRIIYEVKTLSPNNSKERILSFFDDGIGQLIDRFPYTDGAILVVN